MKKSLLSLILCTLAALPGISQQTAATATPTYPYMSDKTLPDFNILEVDSTTVFNTSSLPGGRPIILMYFSPDCEHCQHMTEDILKDMDSLKDVRFVMLTVLPFDKMRNFYQYYKLANYKNIIMGRDYQFFFPAHYGTSYVPYIAIYDRHKKLVKTFDGNAKVSTLIQLVNEN
jgi:thiol-disulfide isomerase/thioredoxin